MRRQQLADRLILARDRLDLLRILGLDRWILVGSDDPRIHHVGLAPLIQLVADELPNLRQRLRIAHVGSNFTPSRGKLIKNAHIEIAIQRESQRSRNGRRGHYQQVRIQRSRAAFAKQGLALGDAEFVLFVDDHQAQTFQGHPILQQRVRTNPHLRSADNQLSRARILAGATAAGSQRRGNPQRAEPLRNRAMQLLSEDLGGCHHGYIPSALQRHERGQRGDNRLARTHVALQQSAHWDGPGKIGAQLPQNAHLRPGEFKSQSREKGFHQPVVSGARRRLCLAFQFQTATLDHQLKVDEFIERQTLTRPFRIFGFRREMEPPNGLGAPGQGLKKQPGLSPVSIPCGAGVQRFDLQLRMGIDHQPCELLHRAPQDGAQGTLLKSFGEGINRDHSIEMNRRVLAWFRLFRFRMIHRAGSERIGATKRHAFVPHGEKPLHEGQVPPTAMQPRRAIVEDQLKHRAPVAKSLHPGRHDAPENGCGQSQLQVANRAEPASILVAARRVKQEVVHRAQAEPFQQMSPLRSHAPDPGDRSLQGTHRAGRCPNAGR